MRRMQSQRGGTWRPGAHGSSMTQRIQRMVNSPALRVVAPGYPGPASHPQIPNFESRTQLPTDEPRNSGHAQTPMEELSREFWAV